MRLALRIITVLCYLLPFTFYLWLGIGTAYNLGCVKKKLVRAANYGVIPQSDTLKFKEDTTHLLDYTLNGSNRFDNNMTAVVKEKADTIHFLKYQFAYQQYSRVKKTKGLTHFIFPTSSSISGVGCILLHKNLIGMFFMALSFVLTLTVLFVNIFAKENYGFMLALLLTNLLCFIIFIIDSKLYHVSLLWGMWVTLILIIIQSFITNRDYVKYKYDNNQYDVGWLNEVLGYLMGK